MAAKASANDTPSIDRTAPRRVLRTYGNSRPKEAAEAPTSPKPQEIPKYASSSSPLSSPPPSPHSRRSPITDVSQSSASLAHDSFGWAEKLAALDRELEDEDDVDFPLDVKASLQIVREATISPRVQTSGAPNLGVVSSSPHTTPPTRTRRKARRVIISPSQNSDSVLEALDGHAHLGLHSAPKSPGDTPNKSKAMLSSSTSTQPGDVNLEPDPDSEMENRKNERVRRKSVSLVSTDVEVPTRSTRISKKIKKPSKKQVVETQKESARLKAGQRMSFPTQLSSGTRTIAQFLDKIRLRNDIISDPIESFSSSPKNQSFVSLVEDTPELTHSYTTASSSAPHQTPKSPTRPPRANNGILSLHMKSLYTLSSDEDENDEGGMMHPDELIRLRVNEDKQDMAARAKSIKLKALAAQASRSAPETSSDADELIIDAKASPSSRPPTITRSFDPKLSKRRLIPPHGKGKEESQLELAAHPAFLDNAVHQLKSSKDQYLRSKDALPKSSPNKAKNKRRAPRGSMPSSVMNAAVLRRAEEKAAAIQATKAKDYEERGGILKDSKVSAQDGGALSGWLNKAKLRDLEDEAEAEEKSDEDYQPDQTRSLSQNRDLNGHIPASPSPSQGVGDISLARPLEFGSPNPSLFFKARSSLASPLSQVGRRKPPGDSDGSDNDSDRGSVTLPRKSSRPNALSLNRAPRRVVVSDEEDGGNDVPESLGLTPSSRALTPRSPTFDSDAENAHPIRNNSDAENHPPRMSALPFSDARERKPLVPHASFHSPAHTSLPGDASQVSLFTQASPSVRRFGDPLNLEDVGSVEPSQSDLEFGGMSQLFQSTQSRKQTDRPSQAPFGLADLRRRSSSDLDLASQVTGLLPSADISESRRNLNDVLLIQQEDALLTRQPLSSPRELPKFINEFGIFTQTDSPSWSKPVFSQAINDTEIPSAPIPRSSTSPSPTVNQHSRLLRGRRDPRSSPSPTILARPLGPKPRNAFDALMAPPLKRPPKDLAKAEQAAFFLEGEAAESDDETPFGLGPKMQDDEDEEDEDSDSPIVGLVDDAEMDANVEAKDLVLEKAQEHAAEDDAEALRIAQQAVRGDFRAGRKKRQRGFGLDDDSDSDNDRTDHPVRDKKRKIKDDKLLDLGKNPETMPFFAAYQKGIEDDDELPPPKFEDEQASGDEESGSDGGPDVVSTADITQELRNNARQKVGQTVTETFDPDNTSWMKNSSDDETDTVDVVQPKSSRTISNKTKVDLDFEYRWNNRHLTVHDPDEWARLMRWKEQEAQNGSLASARGRGGAVTGHSARRSTAPGGRGQVASGSKARKPDSALSTLNRSKQGRFSAT